MRNFAVFCADCFIFSAFAIAVDIISGAKQRELRILARFSPASIFLITNILVSKVTVFLVLFTRFCKRGQSVFLMDVTGGKNHNQLIEPHQNSKRRNTCTPKRSRSTLSTEMRLELRQWCTTSRECSVWIDKGRRPKTNRRKIRPYPTRFQTKFSRKFDQWVLSYFSMRTDKHTWRGADVIWMRQKCTGSVYFVSHSPPRSYHENNSI